MKTITIKLPPRDAERLDKYIKEKQFSSKSEFIRNLILQKLDKEYEFKEQMGWLSLAEQTLQELWNNKEDDDIWSNYL